MGSEPPPYTLLLPVETSLPLAPFVELACLLMPIPSGEAGSAGRIVVLPFVGHATGGAAEQRAELEAVRDSVRAARPVHWPPRIEILPAARASARTWERIVEAAQEESASLILLPWTQVSGAVESAMDRVARNATCDVVVGRPRPASEINSVMVPVRGGPHAALALLLGTRLAHRVGAPLTALHVDRPDLAPSARDRERSEFSAVVDVASSEGLAPAASRTIVSPAPALESVLLHESVRHQFLVMGAPAARGRARVVVGPLAGTLAGVVGGAVVVVRTRLPGTVTHEEWRRLYSQPDAAEEVPPEGVASVVNTWLRQNTFVAAPPPDLARLAELKRSRGLSVSVGLVTTSASGRARAQVRTLAADLLGDGKLVDEMVLIERSGSARVDALARELEPVSVLALPTGARGDVLWQSLHRTRGEIVVWLELHTGSSSSDVGRLVEPLLVDPRLRYVSGFPRSILRRSERSREGVSALSELLARPLLNLAAPELTGVVQPLGHAFAARRAALEQVPIVAGAAVEFGLLLDMFRRFGLSAIGQAGLDAGGPRRSPLRSLTDLASSTFQVVLERQKTASHTLSDEDRGEVLRLLRQVGEAIQVEEYETAHGEYPPLGTVRSYQERSSTGTTPS